MNDTLSQSQFVTVDSIRDSIIWLDNWPAGLKLNTELSRFLFLIFNASLDFWEGMPKTDYEEKSTESTLLICSRADKCKCGTTEHHSSCWGIRSAWDDYDPGSNLRLDQSPDYSSVRFIQHHQTGFQNSTFDD